MEYIDFILENYIWFLVAFIVIVMTIIGYYAEQTEFGRKVLGSEPKPKSEKKKKKKNRKDLLEEIMEEQNAEPNQDNREDLVKTETTPKTEIKKEENASMKVNPTENNHVEEDLYAPLGDKKEPVIEKQTIEPKKIAEEKLEEPVQKQLEEKRVRETPNFEMPTVKETKEVTIDEKNSVRKPEEPKPTILKETEEVDEDDVWNF